MAVFYNVLLFIPLGMYVALFNLHNIKKVIAMVIFSCMTIEISRLLFSGLGLVVPRHTGMEIGYMLLNILGGILGFLLGKATIKIFNLQKQTMEAEASNTI
ncbi:hypothetical protein [Lysinibacillus sphaericus]|uniref:VanZ-like domain-containing protein n=1 Tax=Lysinibacillus sphaericus OT4b.31 TaxID=1285586 RepID=R7ZEP6_LYSSH|nr:hypothetical protein [Lysinibacillus sphaericus]EON72582.1 hypothetical protein H131_10593 [Lysinibacillus sphaericus OT4b.31]